MHGNVIDLTGQRFVRWLVLERAANDKQGGTRWLCRCECGREKIVQGGSLRNGSSRMCRHCGPIKHGLTGTKLYKIWKGIIARCENLNDIGYKRYGGRGISVCPEWRNDPAAFINWALANGYKEGLTIDRVDNNGGYGPDNCQFITRSENTSKAWHVDGSYKERRLTAS